MRANLILFLGVASAAVPPECTDQCAGGISGLGSISDSILARKASDGINGVCKEYASTVAGHSFLRACGHTDAADAIEQCDFGLPPKHCFRHKNAGVAVIVVSHIAAIVVWFAIADMIASLE